MLKKIYIKNGIIMISNINNMEINYNIINSNNDTNSNTNNNTNKSIKKYYEKYGCIFDKK